MKELQYIPVHVIQSFMVDTFVALGTPLEDARICAEVLIASDLRGIESHGIGRLKYYYDRIVSGRHLTRTEIEVVQETETTAVIDGHHGMGHVIAHRAMSMAIDKAGQHGLGAVSVRNSTHFGIAGYYALMAAEAGMMGFAFTNARPSIAPTFGSEPMLGTNPIAFAAPSDGDFPFCFDGATSIAQRGKVEVAARTGKPLPEGWVIDRDGNPATDAPQILREMERGHAALLPLGGAGELYAGYKGYDLATLVEILSASLSGGAFMKELLGTTLDGARRPYMLGHFFLAINIQHFVPLEQSRQITGCIMRALQESRKATGHDAILVAGEKEHRNQAVVRRRGIPVNPSLVLELQTVRDALGIRGYEGHF
jgi:LDH2 family malate/lactate/ureidoglycolate dehydrogenase